MGDGQSELEHWAKQVFGGHTAVASLTLNFKQGRRFPAGWVRITPEIASRQIQWLFRNLDRKVFGNAFKRQKRETDRLVVHEIGNFDCRLHAHIAVGIPKEIISPVKFLDEVNRLWALTNWGYGHGDVSLCEIPNAWITYILKNGAEGIDLGNTRLPTPLY